jgi:HSP20 family molecular chaperone IbpA
MHHSNDDFSDVAILPRLEDYLMINSNHLITSKQLPFDQWDATLIPVEVTETTTSVICTLWLNKLTVHHLQVNCTRRKLNIRVTSSTKVPNYVTYEREIDLTNAVDSQSAEVLFNGEIATIKLPKAQAGTIWRILENTITVFAPHRNHAILHVEKHA